MLKNRDFRRKSHNVPSSLISTKQVCDPLVDQTASYDTSHKLY